uniref:Bromodomain adjacent to zinc finger domain protein 1A n=1 Tax=Phallusia mammillata TaxID=59560 RepID=A0A6F9D871_9ASCI|nr:bromodomain adjacent to zinc finger domain protein 1A [Phallusia mammillata]
MPLLHKKLFVPNKVPGDLNPDEEVFHCTLTNEIFRDYEEFYERTILCNSLVWSCSITDRPNLTFQEALDCEKAARKRLLNFPISLQKPILYLVGLSCRSRIEELNDDIYGFVKERYFVGEEVDAFLGEKSRKTTCHVTKVISSKPNQNGHMNGEEVFVVKDSSDEDEDDLPLSSYQKPKPFDAADIKYRVKTVTDGIEEVVPMSKVRRRKSMFTRQGNKLFLKANCEKPTGYVTEAYVVKEKLKHRLKLASLQWENIFVGPKPSFACHSPKSKSAKLSPSDGRSKSGSKEYARDKEKEEKRKEREEFKKKKAVEIEKLRETARLDKEKKRREKEEEIIKNRLERENIKHQKQEEKRRLTEYLKEWSRPRDDLECDDLKELPSPQEISCQVPPSLFGQVLSLIEFFHVFSDIFEVQDEFPKGVDLDLLTKAVMQHDHDGPLCDLFFFFLSNLFRAHSEEEESFERILTEPGDKELAAKLSEVVNEETIQAFSTIAATWPMSYQGFPLNKLELDSYTLSEVLRIYLLSSATRPRSEDRLWRYQHRGGYSSCDDTPLRLCFDRPELVEKLATTSIFDLEPEEKLSLLQCLAHHLLSFVTSRDYLDETWDKLVQARNTFREDKAAEKKREKESAADKWKWKSEQWTLEKQARNKEIEERIKRIERGLPPEPEPDETRILRKRKTGDEDEPRLLNALEKEERLRLFDEEEAQAKDAWNFRFHKHQQTIAKHQASYRTMPLGQDRFFRRYWVVSTAPGIFVEEFVDESLTDDLLTVRVPQKQSPFLSLSMASGRSTPGLSDSSAAGTPVGSGSTRSLGAHLFSPILINTDLNGVPSSAKVIPRTASPCPATSPSFAKQPPANLGSSPAVTLQQTSAQTPQDGAHGQSANGNQPTKVITQGKQHRWFVYSSVEDLNNLMSALNTRGYRESKLLESLLAQKNVIAESLTVTSDLVDVEKLVTNAQNNSPHVRIAVRSEETMQNLLADQILEMETRIWAGTLGFIQVEDREEWRESVKEGSKYDGKIHVGIPEANEDEVDDSILCDPLVKFPITKTTSEAEKSALSEDVDMETDDCIVRNLAIALYIVEKGVDRKYLKPPLGCAVDTSRTTRSRAPDKDEDESKGKESEALLKRWETSLLQSTSLSQIFLHLSTLDRCIMWSKSVLNAKCRICRRKGDAEKMLLCDSCDRGHHMYCLRPAIKIVPAGDWYCPDCKPKSARISPRKVVRTKSFSQDESSEEEEEDDEEDTEESAEEQDENDSISSIEEVPVKRNLTYKIPQKPQKKGQKPSSAKKSTSESRRERSTRRNDDTPEKSNNRRRATGVWKDLASCEEILSELIKHKDSWPFVEPVSKKAVPDYYDIIKKPMDLGTVHKKMKEVQYPTPTEFISDVDQIFLNCHEYNESRSVVAKAATSLQIFFDTKLGKASISHYRAPVHPTKKRRTT